MALPSIDPNRTPLETGSVCLVFHDPAGRTISDGFVQLLEMVKPQQDHGYELWTVRHLRDGNEYTWWVHDIDLVTVPCHDGRPAKYRMGAIHAN